MGRNHVDQPGLRARMDGEGARISSQHRQLDTLYQMLLSALSRGSESAARQAFQRFADAFDAHISLEDGFYFPAVRAMYPDVAGALAELTRQHDGYRRDLEALAELFEQSDMPACEAPLGRFVEDVARHEAEEEALLGRLTGFAGAAD